MPLLILSTSAMDLLEFVYQMQTFILWYVALPIDKYTLNITQSAGAVEYTDCTSAEG